MSITDADRDLVRASGLFDEAWYRGAYPDVARLGEIDPLDHFLWLGWRLGRRPGPAFDTRHYCRRYPDIGGAGVNPLLHYLRHGRAEKRSIIAPVERWAAADYRPSVSIIVPNYNHARFLDQRLGSIMAQTYRHFEVLLLDDCSTDDSRAVIARWVAEHPGVIRPILNDVNAGNVFAQWRRGMEAARGDLVWICESDDFCEADCLAQLVAPFADDSVNIAFGRIQMCDAEGRPQDFLDGYRERAEAGIWDAPMTRPAAQWFGGALGVANVISNVGGCVFRRQVLSADVWAEAQGFRVVGDWFLYAHLAGGGQIAYVPGAVAWFRQHGGNTSVSAFTSAWFYAEHHRLMAMLRKRWGVPSGVVRRFVEGVADQYRHFEMEASHGLMAPLLDQQVLLATGREERHVLIAFLGFHSGGGEVFPIHLANALRAGGVMVSMLAFDGVGINPAMRAALAPGIAVYDADWVQAYGLARFLGDAGVTCIHAHAAALDMFLIEGGLPDDIGYVTTLHGSYDGAGLPAARVAALAARMDRVAYLADKNLVPFVGAGVDLGAFVKLPNAMPDDLRPFPMARAEMGIPEEAVVFALVARGIERKGWRAAIMAFKALRARHPGQPMHLCLAGEGEMADAMRKAHGADPNISFLGYCAHVPGLYRLSDVALVPTRFAGESFPLCLIEAFQAGTPAIATAIGEIPAMIGAKDAAGLLVEEARNTPRFIEALTDAMAQMLDAPTRARLAAGAVRAGATYRMDEITQRYIALYDEATRPRATHYAHAA